MKNNDFPSLSSNDLGACSVPACLPSPRFCTYLFCIILYFPTGSFCLQIIYVLFTSQHQSSRKYTSCSDSYLSRRLAVSQFITGLNLFHFLFGRTAYLISPKDQVLIFILVHFEIFFIYTMLKLVAEYVFRRCKCAEVV